MRSTTVSHVIGAEEEATGCPDGPFTSGCVCYSMFGPAEARLPPCRDSWRTWIHTLATHCCGLSQCSLIAHVEAPR
jgi:hypothetical protein